MPIYLTTGRNPAGRKVTERHEATSADEVMRILRDRGYDEIVLHTSEVEAGIDQRRGHKAVLALTPGEHLRLRRLPPRLAFFLNVVSMSYRKTWLPSLLALCGLAYLLLSNVPHLAFLKFALAVYLAAPVVVALIAQFFRGEAGRFRRLREAVSWGRWDEVLRSADRVGPRIPADYLTFEKAKAMAGLGRLDEALAIIETFGDGGANPDWMYWSRLASIYAQRRAARGCQGRDGEGPGKEPRKLKPPDRQCPNAGVGLA